MQFICSHFIKLYFVSLFMIGILLYDETHKKYFVYHVPSISQLNFFISSCKLCGTSE